MPNFITKTWNFLKRQWKKIVGVAVVGTALAAGEIILTPDVILQDYLLKAPKEKILFSQEVDWLERQPDGTKINKGKKVIYFFKSDKEAQLETYAGRQENLSMKLPSMSFFDMGGGKWVTKTILPNLIDTQTGEPAGPFYKDIDGKWKEIESATTTPDAFLQQTKPSVFEKMFAVYAVATTTYSGAGDGYLGSNKQSTWAAAYSAAGSLTFVTDIDFVSASVGNDTPPYYIYRVGSPYYTVGIPNGSTITTSTLYQYVNSINLSNSGDAYAYHRMVETFQASHTTLVNADFVDIGYDAGNETGGRAASGVAVAGAADVNTSSMVVGQWETWDFNATGLGWIKVNGQSATCGAALTGWTCLGIREGHDATNNAIPLTKGEYVDFASAESTAPPYLTIGYTLAVAAAEPDQSQVIIFEEQ